MKFFKYLVFIIISLFSVQAFALSGYRSGSGDCAETKEAACASAFANRPLSFKNAYRYEVIGDYCNFYEKRFSSSGS
ncbi:methyl-accepting chemotaxis protein, partial [Acinetobacter baumannii]